MEYLIEYGGLIVGALVGLLGACFWTLRIRHDVAALPHAIVSFGPKVTLSPEERQVLFQETLRQQRRSFGLLWFAVALGTVLAGVLVGRLIFSPSLDLALVASATATAGDITIATYANKMYKTVSARLDDLIQPR